MEPADCSIMGFKTIYLDPNFLIDSLMPPVEQEVMIAFKWENIDVSTWLPLEMIGISPDVINHWLYVDPSFKLVKQKPHRSTPHHVNAVNKEVKKLL